MTFALAGWRADYSCSSRSNWSCVIFELSACREREPWQRKTLFDRIRSLLFNEEPILALPVIASTEPYDVALAAVAGQLSSSMELVSVCATGTSISS